MKNAKFAKESVTVITELVLPNDTNPLNNLMGGRLLHGMDIATAIAAQSALLCDLAAMNVWDHANGAKWRSVFGISNGAAQQDIGGHVSDDTYTSCGTCPGSELGHDDWLTLFAGNTLASKYQDGHFAYAVIPGGGSGLSAFPPVMYIVDMENASDFNNVIEP